MASDLLFPSSFASLLDLKDGAVNESWERMRSLDDEGAAARGIAGVLVVDVSLVTLLLLLVVVVVVVVLVVVVLLPLSMKVSAVLLVEDVESEVAPRVESASAFSGPGLSSLSVRDSGAVLLGFSVVSDDSSFLWLRPRPWSSFGVCFGRGVFTMLSFLGSEMGPRDLAGELSFGLSLSAEFTRSFSFSLVLSRWYCRGLECMPGRVVPSGDTAVAVTLDMEDLGSLGIGGRLDMETFLEAGPLTTPGLRPDGDLETVGLGELVDRDLELSSFFFALLMVSLRPPVEGLTVNSVFFSPSFLLSGPSPFEDSFCPLSFFSMMVTASEEFPTPTRSLSTMSDRLGPLRFFGGDALALSTEKTGGLSSREAGAVCGCVDARKDEDREADDAVSPVDTLVIVSASLRPFFIFSLIDVLLEEEEEEEEEDVLTFGAAEPDDDEDVDEEEVVVGVVVVVVVVDVVVVVVVATTAAVTVTDEDETDSEDEDVEEVDDDNVDELMDEEEADEDETEDAMVDEGVDEDELTGREGLELELLSFSLLLSFGESDGFENVGEADLSCVMLGFPRLVCFGDMLGCFGLPVEGLGLLLPLGEEL